jgi:adenylate cyclase
MAFKDAGRSSRSLTAGIKRAIARIANAGVAAYPPDTQRRLKIVNMIAALIIVTTLIYAAQQTMTNFELMKPVILINVAIAVMMLLVFFAHRINDVAGGLIIVVTEFIALLAISRYLGHDGGVQVHYIIAAAAPFVVFGLQRIWLVIVIVVAALLLHLFTWFHFVDETAILHIDPGLLNSNYVQAAVTTFGLIAASVYYAFSMAERAKAETDAVLRNVLPDSVVERLKAKPGEAIADGFSSASVLFADIAGFVALARQLGPERTVELLSRLVSAFDDLAQRHGVEKIKTIGDAYMVASGVPVPRADHAAALAAMALDMVETARRVSNESFIPINIRIGMASGPMMAGVIGTRKFSYDVWGDPVNLASRLESASAPGKILVCPGCQILLQDQFILEPHAKLDIKGVGLQDTWFVTGRK